MIKKEYNMWTMTKAWKTWMIRSALRKLTMRWRPITETKKKARVRRWFYLCAWCGQEVPSTIIATLKNWKVKRVNNIIIDHIIPIVDPLIWFNWWDDWIEKAFDEDINNFQLLCRECNTHKTYVVENKQRHTKNIII